MKNRRLKIEQRALLRRAALAATLALSLASAERAAAASALDVDWTKGCGASTCFNSKGAYSLSFSASQFSGPVDISKLLLDKNVLGSNLGSFFSVSFTLGGKKLGNWGDWNLGSVGGDTFSLSGPDLTWNPADGDLVVVLQLVSANGEILDGTDHGGSGGFGDSFSSPDTTDGGTTGSGSQDPPFGGPPNSDGGPIGNGSGGDGPIIDGLGPNGGGVPEPATWALLIGGLATTGAMLRRRRALSLA